MPEELTEGAPLKDAGGIDLEGAIPDRLNAIMNHAFYVGCVL